jgi:tetrapyrrole methylase family protein/MazG family protein
MREGFLEEAYEVVTALDANDTLNLREELGDLLYHIVMQAQMAAEAGEFTLTDVIAGIEAKLKRRHPHVWGDWQVSSSAEVLLNREKLKQEEKSKAADQPPSQLDGVPAALPALARSQKIQARAAAIGFDWPDISGVYDKLVEEIKELREATAPEELRLELGDVLFVVANLAQWLGIGAESALREANDRFTARFKEVERLAAERGQEWGAMTFTEMDALWEEAKATLAKSHLPDKVESEPD